MSPRPETGVAGAASGSCGTLVFGPRSGPAGIGWPGPVAGGDGGDVGVGPLLGTDGDTDGGTGRIPSGITLGPALFEGKPLGAGPGTTLSGGTAPPGPKNGGLGA